MPSVTENTFFFFLHKPDEFLRICNYDECVQYVEMDCNPLHLELCVVHRVWVLIPTWLWLSLLIPKWPKRNLRRRPSSTWTRR